MMGGRGMNKAYNKVFFVMMFLISTFYLYLVTVAEGPIHADELSGIIMGEDIFAKGNLFMHGWNLTTGMTTIQLLWVTLIRKIFGGSFTILYLVSALNYAILANILAYIVFRNINVKGIKRYGITIIVLLMNIIPRSHSIMNVCTHTLIYSMCAVLIYVTYLLYSKNSSIYAYGLLGFVAGVIAAFNITMLYYEIFVIIFVGGVCLWLKVGETRQNVYLVVCGGFEYIISRLCYWIWTMLRGEGFTFAAKEVFVSKDTFVNNIVQSCSNILYEFGIDIWGKNFISLDTAKAVVGLIFIYIIIKGIAQAKKLEKDKKILVIFLLSVSIINLLAYTCSSIPVYSQSTHLMELFSLFVSPAFGICIGNLDIEYTRTIKNSIALFIFVCIFFLINTPQLSIRQESSKTLNVTEFLLSNGYKKGFATFWEASAIMYDSDLNITVAPITIGYDNEYPEGIVGGWKWATKDEWLEQKGTFVLFSKTNDNGIYADKVMESLGQATQYLEIDDYGILLYEDGVELEHIF